MSWIEWTLKKTATSTSLEYNQTWLRLIIKYLNLNWLSSLFCRGDISSIIRQPRWGWVSSWAAQTVQADWWRSHWLRGGWGGGGGRVRQADTTWPGVLWSYRIWDEGSPALFINLSALSDIFCCLIKISMPKAISLSIKTSRFKQREFDYAQQRLE